MPSQDVRLSVCLSVCHTPVITILVLPYQTGLQYSDGDPLNGGAECKGYEKYHNFRPISRFILELMQDRASYYGRRIGNRTQTFEWYQFQ